MIRLTMNAWSLNYRDHMVIQGTYNPRVALPLVPLSDGVGTITEIGPGAQRFQLGDRVMPMLAPTWGTGSPTREQLRQTLGCPLDGVLQEEFVVSEDSAVSIGERLSHEEAATLPCAALTAWNALTLANVKAEDYVLIEGTGGVATFALQFSVAMGAKAIVTSKSDAKLERAKRLGAHALINYTTQPAWGKEARRLADGTGVQCTIDVGGKHTLEQALNATQPGGTIAVIGVLSGTATEVSLVRLMMNQIRLQGVFVGSRHQCESMVAFIEKNQIRPVVDHTQPFEAFPNALTELSTGQHMGKLCLSAAL